MAHWSQPCAVPTKLSQTSQPHAPIICPESLRLIESQKEVNWIKEVTFSNEKLRHIKGKAEVMTFSFESFKRRKLLEVGNRGMFETDRKYGYETAGLRSGFTDILGTQLYYKTVLTVNKAPNYQNFNETTTVDAWVTRSWDNSFNCTDCKVKHSLFRYDYFAVML